MHNHSFTRTEVCTSKQESFADQAGKANQLHFRWWFSDCVPFNRVMLGVEVSLINEDNAVFTILTEVTTPTNVEICTNVSMLQNQLGRLNLQILRNREEQELVVFLSVY